VLPAYNEAARISGTLIEARRYFSAKGWRCQLIVVAEGNDGTREAAMALARSDCDILVAGGSERLGKGRAVRAGMALAVGEYVGYIDADNKTPISEFSKVEPLLLQGWDVVIGSRRRPDAEIGKKQPLHRRLGSSLFGPVSRACFGLEGITDSQCGFKFFSRRAALELFSKQKVDGYMFDVEVLLMARRGGLRIAEVPVRWSDDADSRLDLLSSNARSLLDLVKLRCGFL
jgi:dolichyl-phosphate beta-glucosyltransferase